LITLTSDFGLADSYVAQMKGVILNINPCSIIVDITHEINKFNIQTGAFMLASAAPFFPKGTVHVAIVDPGVGTKRRALLITTKQGYFIGPDNGLLLLAAKHQEITGVYEITNSKYLLADLSDTFHGRDVFAPVAAYLEKGVDSAEFGSKIDDPVKPDFIQVEHEKDNIICRVLYIDSFGNIITNLEKTWLPKGILNIKFQNDDWFELKLKKTYGETKPNDTIALIGSHGFLEIAVNQGNAADMYHVKVGTRVALKT
jgi:S-adenosylmethionine hydrolase